MSFQQVPQIFQCVDILPCGKDRYVKIPEPELGHCLFENLACAQGDSRENIRQEAAGSETDEIIPAVLCGSDHGAVPLQGSKSVMDHLARQVRDIAAHKQNLPISLSKDFPEGVAHPFPQVLSMLGEIFVPTSQPR